MEKPTLGGGRRCCCGEGDEEESRGCCCVQFKDERSGYGSVGWRFVRERRVSGEHIWVCGGGCCC
jgi:hypothetical protein